MEYYRRNYNDKDHDNARDVADIYGYLIWIALTIRALRANTIVEEEGNIFNTAAELANLIYLAAGGQAGISGPNRQN